MDVDRHHQMTPGASLYTSNFSRLDHDPLCRSAPRPRAETQRERLRHDPPLPLDRQKTGVENRRRLDRRSRKSRENPVPCVILLKNLGSSLLSG